MDPTHSGFFALPLNYLKETLAASATWQSLVGASGAAAAKPRIFVGETDEHAAADLRPRALLSIGNGSGLKKINSTGWLGSGTLELALEIEAPPAHASKHRAARVWLLNTVGAILQEMSVLAGRPGYLNIVNFREHNTGRADPDGENGNAYWASVWFVDWLG